MRWHWRTSVLVFPVLAFLGLYAVYASDVPLITPDSEGYLEFAPSRSGGYPFFLALLKPIIRDPYDHTLAQLSLYAVSILILCWQVLLTTNSLAVALVAELALLGNRDLALFDINKSTSPFLPSRSFSAPAPCCSLLRWLTCAKERAGVCLLRQRWPDTRRRSGQSASPLSPDWWFLQRRLRSIFACGCASLSSVCPSWGGCAHPRRGSVTNEMMERPTIQLPIQQAPKRSISYGRLLVRRSNGNSLPGTVCGFWIYPSEIFASGASPSAASAAHSNNVFTPKAGPASLGRRSSVQSVAP
jgi:hypothetical protein